MWSWLVARANAGGFHNFEFADGTSLPDQPRGPSDPAWDDLSRTFSEAGDYTFV
jgi:hypothetical protein